MGGGRETSVCGYLSRDPLTGNLASNPGMCPDWESNQWPFALQALAQSTEPGLSPFLLHGSGYKKIFFYENAKTKIEVRFF